MIAIPPNWESADLVAEVPHTVLVRGKVWKELESTESPESTDFPDSPESTDFLDSSGASGKNKGLGMNQALWEVVNNYRV